jgi:hypothetical protein
VSINLFFRHRSRCVRAVLKVACENQRIATSGARDFGKKRGYRLDGRVPEANAEIQPGSCFDRVVRPGDIDRLKSDELVGFLMVVCVPYVVVI